jgi:catechol 2,3-dioxygenase-like lactoylglutathione lyase family enzyme
VCRGVKPAGTVQRSNFNARMFSFDSFGHINIVVPDIEEATRFYQALFNTSVEQTFPHFKNPGFGRSAGFLEDPESVDVSIRFLKLPFGRSEDLFLELFTFHTPAGSQEITPKKTNDVGGPRHVCLRVTNIDEVFAHVKSLDGVHLINESPEYRPVFISPIKPSAIELPGADRDTPGAKEAICEIVKEIRFFYAIDRYGIQWEFEEGHTDIGTA